MKGLEGNDLNFFNHHQTSEVDEKYGMFSMAQKVNQGLTGEKEYFLLKINRNLRKVRNIQRLIGWRSGKFPPSDEMTNQSWCLLVKKEGL